MPARYVHKEIVQRIHQKCESVGLELLEIPIKIERSTKLRLLCLKHCTVNTMTNVSGLLAGKRGCKICHYEQVSKAHSLSMSDISFRAISTGKFQKGTLFFDSFIKNSKRHCLMYCPVCAKDKYSKAGLCEGIFEGSVKHMTAGHSPCRCSGRFRWKESHRLFQIQELCTLYGEEFVCFNQPYASGMTVITLCCPKHGVYETTIVDFCKGIKRCSLCSAGGYNQSKLGYFYVIQVEGNSEFTGYGITNNTECHLKKHKNNISKDNSFIKSVTYFEMTGENAFNLERIVKEKFERFSQDIDGFRREATLPNMRLSLIDFIHEYCELNSIPKMSFPTNNAPHQERKS